MPAHNLHPDGCDTTLLACLLYYFIFKAGKLEMNDVEAVQLERVDSDMRKRYHNFGVACR